jgi:hypothetical protein
LEIAASFDRLLVTSEQKRFFGSLFRIVPADPSSRNLVMSALTRLSAQDDAIENVLTLHICAENRQSA